jgi:hypothetical protein
VSADVRKSEASTKSAPSKRTIANRLNAKKSTGPKTPEGKANSKRNATKHGLLTQEIHAGAPVSSREFRKVLAGLWTTYTPADVVEEMLVERAAVAYWRLAGALRFDLQERECSFQAAREGEPKCTLDLAYCYYLNDLESKDPEQAQDLIHKRLTFIKSCIKELEENDYLDERSLDMLRSVPGNLYTFASKPKDEPKFSAVVTRIGAPPTGSAPAAPAASATAPTGPPALEFFEQLLEVMNEEYDNLERWYHRMLGMVPQPRCRDLPGKDAVDLLLRYESAIERQFYKALDQLERRQRQRRGEAVPPPINADVEIE